MSRYIISYDISDDKTRNKVEKIISGYIYRVQYSMFEGIISQRSYSDIKKKLSKYLLKENDSIRIYKVCEKCTTQISFFGNPKIIEDMNFMII